MAAAVGLSAYWTALASRAPEAPPAGPPAAQPVPGLVPIGAAERGREITQADLDRAFVRGRRAGFREGKRAARRRVKRSYPFTRWAPGSAYLVTSTSDGRGVAARVGPLKPGAKYGLCRGGRAVCVTPPG